MSPEERLARILELANELIYSLPAEIPELEEIRVLASGDDSRPVREGE